MEIKTEVETRFGDLEMLVAIAPFDQAVAALQRENATLATARQVALARMVAGPKSSISQYGSWVAENFIYFPNGQIFITPAKHSPILKHASKAMYAHGIRKEFYISKEEAASLKKLAKSGEVYTLKQTEDYEIPIEDFAEDGLARFVFGNMVLAYAKFLQKVGINEVPVWLADSRPAKAQKAPFARALWLDDICDLSDLDSYGGLNDDRVRGMRKAKSAGVADTYESMAPAYELALDIREDLTTYFKNKEALTEEYIKALKDKEALTEEYIKALKDKEASTEKYKKSL